MSFYLDRCNRSSLFIRSDHCPVCSPGFLLSRNLHSFLARFGLYVGTTFVMYLGEVAFLNSSRSLQIWQNLLFGLFAVLVVLALRFNEEHQFHTTPLDYLVVFLAISIPWFSEIWERIFLLDCLQPKSSCSFFPLRSCYIPIPRT